MFIKVEPAGFFMYTVQMVFDTKNPDNEDAQVKDYLAQHQLEPRYQWEADFEGRNCQWLQFGGCYLGSHLQGIGQIQRQAVEVELLTEEIDRYLEANPPEVAALTTPARNELVTALVTEFQHEENFAPDEQGQLTAYLDKEQLAQAVHRRLAG